MLALIKSVFTKKQPIEKHPIEKDEYDEAIEYLLNSSLFKTNVYYAWNNPSYVKGGALFKFAGSSQNSGCLTMIRGGQFCVPNRPDLTELIREDKRIPRLVKDITPKSLPVFAEWQRRLDKELERV